MSIIRKDKSNVKGHWVCDLCGYDWESIRDKPKCCPRCTRYDWDRKSPIDTQGPEIDQ